MEVLKTWTTEPNQTKQKLETDRGPAHNWSNVQVTDLYVALQQCLGKGKDSITYSDLFNLLITTKILHV